jgi:hypothetical protein
MLGWEQFGDTSDAFEHCNRTVKTQKTGYAFHVRTKISAFFQTALQSDSLRRRNTFFADWSPFKLINTS